MTRQPVVKAEPELPEDTLAVVSKVKAYLQAKGYRCGGDMAEALSDRIRKLLDLSIPNAEASNRQTVRGVDVPDIEAPSPEVVEGE